ncbi:GNAT family N-acetyltransferase [Planococcus shixiaomingii]|uniref:GNAT family N-acetyltransferase n=1 Tax=Planococcus shixiaomingii TaxID=3058393 RepID=UPI00262EAD93|nr:GNAT family N-acetyltransferase [Planococcus sp. N022]WKA56665.1 GNAT family N-acetyltransferase [Planococcus sp. N022]
MNIDYIVESQRLGFRRWKESDKIPFAAMNADPEVMKYFPNVLTREESDALIDRFEKHFDEKGYGIWAVERKEDQAFIGFIGLLEVGFDVDFKGATEIGWRLDRSFWKNGYAAEGAEACLKYAFEVLKKNEVYSFTAVLNEPSEAVMRRIGMEKVKEFDHPKIAVESPLRRHVLYRSSLK